jgi:plasmid stability protein
MATLTVKNIPEGLVQEIKKKAKYHRRSMNNEIIHYLELITEDRPMDVESLIEQARRLREKVSSRITEKELTRLKNAGRP